MGNVAANVVRSSAKSDNRALRAIAHSFVHDQGSRWWKWSVPGNTEECSRHRVYPADHFDVWDRCHSAETWMGSRADEIGLELNADLAKDKIEEIRFCQITNEKGIKLRTSPFLRKEKLVFFDGGYLPNIDWTPWF